MLPSIKLEAYPLLNFDLIFDLSASVLIIKILLKGAVGKDPVLKEDQNIHRNSLLA